LADSKRGTEATADDQTLRERILDDIAHNMSPVGVSGQSHPGYGRGLLIRLLIQKRFRIAGEAADRAQRHVADDARDAKLGIVDQARGQRLVGR
jgi:hypothetical protein